MASFKGSTGFSPSSFSPASFDLSEASPEASFDREAFSTEAFDSDAFLFGDNELFFRAPMVSLMSSPLNAGLIT